MNVLWQQEVEALLFEAQSFDGYSYMKKLGHSTNVSLLRIILESYKLNSPSVNHAALSVLNRLATTIIPNEEDYSDLHDLAAKASNSNHAAALTNEEKGPAVVGGEYTHNDAKSILARIPVATMEPLLFNIPFLVFCNKVLSDVTIRNSSQRSI